MKRILFFFSVLTLFFISTNFQCNRPLPTIIKIACVGNSITYGAGITNRESKSYPYQLDSILGKDNFDVRNYGVSGCTLLKNGDKPYWNRQEFLDAQSFAPNIVIIKLGSNDSKPQNWKFKSEYITNYVEMIRIFQALPSKPIVYICYPAPAYQTKWGINDTVIRKEMIPLIKKIANETNVKIVDMYKALSDKEEMFPDKIHPDANGALVMAKTIAKELGKLIK